MIGTRIKTALQRRLTQKQVGKLSASTVATSKPGSRTPQPWSQAPSQALPEVLGLDVRDLYPVAHNPPALTRFVRR